MRSKNNIIHIAVHELILTMIDAKANPPIVCKICRKDIGTEYHKKKIKFLGQAAVLSSPPLGGN